MAKKQQTLAGDANVPGRKTGPKLLSISRDRPIAIELERSGNLPYMPIMSNASTTARLEARLPTDVHALLKRAAEIEGRSLTDFVVTAAREAATRVIDEASVVRLSVADQQRFADALINPKPLAPAMERARARHRALIA